MNNLWGGIELTRDRAALPGDEPLFWRERYKRALGRTHHLVRVVALLEIPTVIAVALVVADGRGLSRNPLSGFLDFLWIVAVLIVAIRTVGIWPLERSRETLDVLLTTPLSGRELVDQTMRGVRRTMVAVSIPILTVQLATAMIQTNFMLAVTYVALGLLSLVIVLPLTAWAAMLISLRAKTQFKAAIQAGAALLMFLIIPEVLYSEVGGWGSFNLLGAMIVLAAVGPGIFVDGVNSALGWSASDVVPSFIMFTVVGAWYVGVSGFLRAACARHADAWLGRCATLPSPSDSELTTGLQNSVQP